ncbi:hypothetical protein BpHYR1_052525 [Brachionus plicatilis]|uniref:Uncharacterized protein n=1 Tax=Brachionus plicatilis TaxID=10195 RepID=A0A3M7PJM9_BRAPC|nr:hypothetical protein BpHYR1_052525 [Brachionus plicatilis]
MAIKKQVGVILINFENSYLATAPRSVVQVAKLKALIAHKILWHDRLDQSIDRVLFLLLLLDPSAVDAERFLLRLVENKVHLEGILLDLESHVMSVLLGRAHVSRHAAKALQRITPIQLHISTRLNQPAQVLSVHVHIYFRDHIAHVLGLGLFLLVLFKVIIEVRYLLGLLVLV